MTAAINNKEEMGEFRNCRRCNNLHTSATWVKTVTEEGGETWGEAMPFLDTAHSFFPSFIQNLAGGEGGGGVLAGSVGGVCDSGSRGC